jgi:hypothetical protein
VCVITVQVMLMPEVRAAVDTHAGVVGVAESWLGFSWRPAVERTNLVR